MCRNKTSPFRRDLSDDTYDFDRVRRLENELFITAIVESSFALSALCWKDCMTRYTRVELFPTASMSAILQLRCDVRLGLRWPSYLSFNCVSDVNSSY